MQIAMIGLGRMGQNMAKRLLSDNHEIIAYDPSATARAEIEKHGAKSVSKLADIAQELKGPRIAWIMVPHGAPVDQVIGELAQVLEKGDCIIDGGNSHFLDSIKRSKMLKEKGIDFLDIGVSGGVFGLSRGYCLMAGGDEIAFNLIEPILKSLAPGEKAAEKTPSRTSNPSSAHEGYFYCGKSGAGHYVKMIHNAIEYGMMQAYAEGLDLLHHAQNEDLPEDQRYDFDLREITELWRRGSVVGSWLLDLMANALHKDPKLSDFSGQVSDSGEGRWALMEAIKQGTSAPTLANALFTRFRSRKENPFSEKSLSALRKEFGGHSEHQDK